MKCRQFQRGQSGSLVVRRSLGVESPIEVVGLVERRDDTDSRPVALNPSVTFPHYHRSEDAKLTEVANEPVLHTVITFNPFLPPPRFCHNHSAPFFPISIHLARSSPWTALQVSLTFSFTSSPPEPAFSPSRRICRIRLSASERLTAVGLEDWRWSSTGCKC